MGSLNHYLRKLRFKVIGGLTMPLLMPLSAALLTAEEGPTAVAPAAEKSAVRVLDLAECLRIAETQQPAIDAYRASLAAAEAGRQAVENIRIPSFILRELPYRREQAALGVTTASASLEQARHENRYAVIRLYYSVIFAREQTKVADTVVGNLSETHKFTKEILDKGASREVTQDTVDKITVYRSLAQTRKSEADRGVGRATAALREAIGIEPECCIKIIDDTLPVKDVKLCVDDVIQMALARRPEITLAMAASEVTMLEVKAQGTKCFASQAKTFASASDIHANHVPQGTANGEYRPGAVGLEMPTTLVGSKKDRIARAEQFFARAAAVVNKTRGLIALDAENTFLKWEEANNKVGQTRTAKETARKLADNTRKGYTSNQKVKPEDVLTNEVLAAQAEAQYNEALWNLIIALADLERVTAGGFSANFLPHP